ncbi:hypothetical protein QUA56_22215 [Microcoleus sp. N3A4]|uniref:hypothetical protein n=1 Tax=Microcoleus sp. N3A4 TaxID=3055379 RepID=UPI002FD25CBA
MMNAIVDTETGRILKCSLLCHEASEVILTVQMVMQAQMPHIVLRDGVLAHPTMTEGLNMLFSGVVSSKCNTTGLIQNEKTRRKSRSCHRRH